MDRRTGGATMIVLAADRWPTNGHLIEAVAALGYLRREWTVLDATYGHGVFWRQWKPADPGDLIRYDLDPTKSPDGEGGIDFRRLPHPDVVFDAVVLDGPYKLNGTSAEDGDERFGVDGKASWQERHQLIREGITECARVLRPAPRTSAKKRAGYLLLKCQDQTCSGAVRWQTIEFANHAASIGLILVDRLQMLGTGRPQPARTRKDGKPSVQQHAHSHPSTLLIFRKPT